MLDWIRRAFRRADGAERQRFFGLLDMLNAEAGGGEPTAATRSLGRLKIPSGTLVLGDPFYLPGLEVPNIPAGEAEISVSVRRYPSGGEMVTRLRIGFGFGFGEGAGDLLRRKVGEVGIDTGKLVVADLADIDEHWAATGKDRIGVISAAPDDTVLRLLTKRFQLETVRVNIARAEVVGPVSEELAAEIEAFLKADPRYSTFTFMYFRIETNSSFDRASGARQAYAFLPIGNSPEPLMFVCETGRGDGRYEVHGEFEEDRPRVLGVTFIDDLA
jgi:hypothetical protein